MSNENTIPSDISHRVPRWIKASDRFPTQHKEYLFWDTIACRYGISYYCGVGRSIIERWPDRTLWLEEAEAPTAQPVCTKERVIFLIKLYQSQIPEEKYDWEEHVRDLDNIIYDIENNLQPSETPAPGEDHIHVQLPSDVMDWIRKMVNQKEPGPGSGKELDVRHGLKTGAIAMYQLQIDDYRKVLGKIANGASGQREGKAAQEVLEKYKH